MMIEKGGKLREVVNHLGLLILDGEVKTMGFISSLIDNYKRKIQERNDACASLIEEIDNASRSMNAIFSDVQNFIDPQQATIWTNQNAVLLNRIAMPNITWMRKANRYNQLITMQAGIMNMVQLLPQRIQQHNANVASARVRTAYAIHCRHPLPNF